jgi:hypothetical protein
MPYAPNTIGIAWHSPHDQQQLATTPVLEGPSTLKHKRATARATPLWSTELCAACALLPHRKSSHFT